jgi:hypothetical protein
VILLVIAGGVALEHRPRRRPRRQPGPRHRLRGGGGALLRREPLRDRAPQHVPAARLGADRAARGRCRRRGAALIAARRLRITRAALPLVVASGLAELGGFTAYAVGARHGIAVAAVLASQFAALAVIAAFLLFAERLTRTQVAGVVAIAIGVAALSALRA